MCCRYAVKNDARELAKRYNAIKANFNYSSKEAFPATYNPVVLNNNGIEIYLLKWGFLLGNGQLVINARCESASIKPLFKESFFQKRCLIPANAFFEWKKEDKKKIKHTIEINNQEIFSFAGLYDNFLDKNGGKTTGFVILTTEPNSEMTKIHNRMPVILNPKNEGIWIDKSSQQKDLQNLFAPYDAKYTDIKITA